MLLLEHLKEDGAKRKEQAKEICEYFNCKLGGSKIPSIRCLDIERALRVMEAVDVLETLEEAYYFKVKIIDGAIAPRSYAAFMAAIPKYLYYINTMRFKQTAAYHLWRLCSKAFRIQPC